MALTVIIAPERLPYRRYHVIRRLGLFSYPAGSQVERALGEGSRWTVGLGCPIGATDMLMAAHSMTSPLPEMLLISTSAPMAPSEIVLLNADLFVAEAEHVEQYRLADTGIEVPLRALVKLVYATALLSDEAIGNLVLEIRPSNVPFQRFVVDSVCALPGRYAATWPKGSIESRLWRLVRSARGGDNCVQAIVHGLIGSDQHWPFQYALRSVSDGLVVRELVQRTIRKRLRIFNVSADHVPSDTLMSAREWVDPVRETLEAVQEKEPRLWTLLMAEIERGIESRRSIGNTYHPLRSL